MITSKEILLRAKEMLNDPARWHKGDWAADPTGKEVGYSSSEAVCWCVGGAVRRANIDLQGERPSETSVYLSLDNLLNPCLPRECQISGEDFARFNDREETTHEDIMALLECAIAQQE